MSWQEKLQKDIRDRFDVDVPVSYINRVAQELKEGPGDRIFSQNGKDITFVMSTNDILLVCENVIVADITK